MVGDRNFDLSKVDLGPFNSDMLKISWFRFAQMAGEVMENGRKVTRTVRWEPQWFGIFSWTWLRERGPRPREPYLKHVKGLKAIATRDGFPDKDVRLMIADLIHYGRLMELPHIDPATLTPDWFGRLQSLPVSAEAWENEVGLAKILVVESDKGRRVMLHYATRQHPRALELSRKLHTEAARLMATYVPELGGMRVEHDK